MRHTGITAYWRDLSLYIYRTPNLMSVYYENYHFSSSSRLVILTQKSEAKRKTEACTFIGLSAFNTAKS